MEAGTTKETVLRTSSNKGGYYHLPGVPRAYFGVMVPVSVMKTEILLKVSEKLSPLSG